MKTDSGAGCRQRVSRQVRGPVVYGKYPLLRMAHEPLMGLVLHVGVDLSYLSMFYLHCFWRIRLQRGGAGETGRYMKTWGWIVGRPIDSAGETGTYVSTACR